MSIARALPSGAREQLKTMLAALALSASAAVSAQTTSTGNTLLSWINGNDAERLSAIGYVSGVIDSLAGIAFCPPRGATVGQAEDIVARHLLTNPGTRHKPAVLLTAEALAAAWPCKRARDASDRAASMPNF